jgi:dTDP-4-dehydrorhamnose 3,5-epimerase
MKSPEKVVLLAGGCGTRLAEEPDVKKPIVEIGRSTYGPAAARGLAFDDLRLAIAWPLAKPILSAADRSRPSFDQAEVFA